MARRTYRRKRKIYRGKPGVMVSVRNSLLVLLLGCALGAVSKWADLHSPFLAEMTSGIALWILLASLLALYSRNEVRAGLHALLFLGGMLAAYYTAAELLKTGWSTAFLTGWSVLALLSPVLGYLVRRVKEQTPRLLYAGIILAELGATWLLFRRIGMADLLVVLMTVILLLLSENGKSGRKQ
ncbi:MAG: hypothetical protein K2O18_01110 [Oscillospiraceae bacterium]|nr:hypothetical protein [Oscillospiraceae bacterium]